MKSKKYEVKIINSNEGFWTSKLIEKYWSQNYVKNFQQWKGKNVTACYLIACLPLFCHILIQIIKSRITYHNNNQVLFFNTHKYFILIQHSMVQKQIFFSVYLHEKDFYKDYGYKMYMFYLLYYRGTLSENLCLEPLSLSVISVH